MSVYLYVAIVKYWTKISKYAVNHARNSPFPLRHVDFHLTHECLGPPHSPRQTTALSLYALSHNDATNSPLVTVGRHKFTHKLPLPLQRSPPKSNTPIPSPTPRRIINVRRNCSLHWNSNSSRLVTGFTKLTTLVYTKLRLITTISAIELPTRSS